MFSSTSYSLNMHFCMGELDSIALFDSVKGCGMEHQKPDCHKKQATHQLDSKSCCEDQSIEVDAQDEVLQTTTISVSEFQLVAVAYIVVPELFLQASAQYIPFQDYTPPLIKRDIPVLIQSFLL
nr:hypothetical protein [Marivirga aurantiaca]